MSSLSDNCVNKHNQDSFQTITALNLHLCFYPSCAGEPLSVSLSLSLSICLSLLPSFSSVEKTISKQPFQPFKGMDSHSVPPPLPGNQLFSPIPISFIASLSRCKSKILPNIIYVFCCPLEYTMSCIFGGFVNKII